MDPSKIKTIQEWATPQRVKDVQSFLGFTNFYRRERTWEPVENVINARALIEDFHRQYPEKPSPPSKTTRNTRRLKGGVMS